LFENTIFRFPKSRTDDDCNHQDPDQASGSHLRQADGHNSSASAAPSTSKRGSARVSESLDSDSSRRRRRRPPPAAGDGGDAFQRPATKRPRDTEAIYDDPAVQPPRHRPLEPPSTAAPVAKRSSIGLRETLPHKFYPRFPAGHPSAIAAAAVAPLENGAAHSQPPLPPHAARRPPGKDQRPANRAPSAGSKRPKSVAAAAAAASDSSGSPLSAGKGAAAAAGGGGKQAAGRNRPPAAGDAKKPSRPPGGAGSNSGGGGGSSGASAGAGAGGAGGGAGLDEGKGVSPATALLSPISSHPFSFSTRPLSSLL
jgi:hypothetical protein